MFTHRNATVNYFVLRPPRSQMFYLRVSVFFKSVLFQAKQENIEELLSQADRLVSEQPEPEAAVYEAMADILGTAWKDLNKQLQLRGHLLDDALAFFSSVQKVKILQV